MKTHRLPIITSLILGVLLIAVGAVSADDGLQGQADAPTGPGSVSGAPNLPPGFTDTFTIRYIGTGGLCQHAVIGGDGPPLLLVHGWPENWYAWRLVMPALPETSRSSQSTSAVWG